MRIAERKRLIEAGGALTKTKERDERRSLRTLGSDSVGRVSRQFGGRVCRILCVGRVEGVEIGRAGLVGHRGWKLWGKIVSEAGEDLFVQVLQVHIDWREFWSWHGSVGKSELT